MRTRAVAIASSLALGAGLTFSACGGSGSSGAAGATTTTSAATGATSSTADAPGPAFQQELVSVIGRVRPAVVEIRSGNALGSGVLFDSKGDVVTNNHVANGAKTFTVVVAIGNPLGLASSVTEGIVSFNGRTVTEPNNVVLPSTIQTSAPINPGNSGGALVDLAGPGDRRPLPASPPRRSSSRSPVSRPLAWPRWPTSWPASNPARPPRSPT